MMNVLAELAALQALGPHSQNGLALQILPPGNVNMTTCTENAEFEYCVVEVGKPCGGRRKALMVKRGWYSP